MKNIIRTALVAAVLIVTYGISNMAMASSSFQQEIGALLTMQADAWNHGDLDKFMTGYLDSKDISYTSGGVEVWGYQALRDRYVKKYGDKRDTMGQLSFSDIKEFDLGKDNALCIGHWHLMRQGQPQLDGIFSLVLVRTADGWKIIHDHTSSIANK